MATVSITNHYVNPTENDFDGGTDGAGIVLTEASISNLLKNQGGVPGFVVSGFTPPTTGTGNRTQNITGGIASTDGYVIYGSATTSVVFTQGVTEYWWLQLLYTSNKVSGLQYTSVSGATTYPGNAIPLWAVTCNASDVTTVVDRRPQNRRLYGTVTGGNLDEAGSGYWSVSLGATGVHTLTFGSGIFTRKPVVTATIYGSSGGEATCVVNSATSATITTRDSSGAAANRDWSFEARL
jgi:hypothetical protein